MWTPSERAAWKPPERLGVITWNERFRTLGNDQSDAVGPFRFSRSPHTRGIVRLMQDARRLGIEEIFGEKCAQSGLSEAVRCYLAWLADQNPLPVMLILPTEQKGREIIAERIIPMFEGCEPLKSLQTEYARDMQKSFIRLANGFVLFLGWSGSPTSLASHPVAVIVADECDKFEIPSGREANPLSLARQRLKKFGGRQLLIAISTPTLPEGEVHSGREQCPIQLRYYVPCPHCGEFQRLVYDRLKIPPAELNETRQQHATRLEVSRNVGYECRACRVVIEQSHQRAMIGRGVWAAVEAAELPEFPDMVARSEDGIVYEGWPPGRKVGLHLSDLSVPWVEWWRTASAGVEAGDDPIKLQDFRNSRLGEPHKPATSVTMPDVFAAKSLSAVIRPGTVPPWATVLLATADVQKDYFVWVVRAWGPRMRSCRVAHGTAATFDELRRLTIDSSFEVIGENRTMQPFRLAIDTSGTRTHDVYAFILANPIRVLGMRGSNRALPRHIQTSRGNFTPAPGQPTFGGDLWVHDIDTTYYKDRLASMVSGKIQTSRQGEVIEIDQWELNADDDPEYNKQMSSESRVQRRKGNRMVWQWEPVTSGAANHYWDCENYQVALTEIVRLEEVTSEAAPQRAAPAGPAPAAITPPKPLQVSRPNWMPAARGARRGYGG